MDKSYSTPRDVGNASIDDVVRALNRVLRSVEGSTNFIYQSEFEYANGRKAPLLMVGALRGPWRGVRPAPRELPGLRRRRVRGEKGRRRKDSA
jgi:hypothetical protein